MAGAAPAAAVAPSAAAAIFDRDVIARVPWKDVEWDVGTARVVRSLPQSMHRGSGASRKRSGDTALARARNGGRRAGVIRSRPMQPQRDRVDVPSRLLAVLCGAVLGLVVFAASAALWRAGMHTVAGLAAETILLLALTC